MDSKNLKYLSKEESFRFCSTFTRKRSWKLWLMTQLMMSNESRNYIYLCHTYLRWVDDFVDDPQKTIEDKQRFILDQKQVFQVLRSNKEVEFNSKEEMFLFYLLERSLSGNDNVLVENVYNVLEGIHRDVYRLENDGIFLNDKLIEYIDLQSKTFSTIINHFLMPSFKPQPDMDYVGRFYWYALTVRDFLDDLDSGYINISREDLGIYNLNYQKLKDDKNRFRWMEDKYQFIMQLLEKEKFVLKSYPMKLKAFWVPGYISLLIELVRIKEYGYIIGEKINKRFFREIKVFLEALGIYSKFAFRVYSYIPRKGISKSTK